jgi:hypothetical protein
MVLAAAPLPPVTMARPFLVFIGFGLAVDLARHETPDIGRGQVLYRPPAEERNDMSFDASLIRVKRG